MSQLPNSATSSQQEEERIEPLVTARLEQRLAAQLRDVAKVLLASARAGCSVLESAASMGSHELLREILSVFQASSDTGTAQPDIRSDLRAATLAAASNGQPQCLQLLLDSCASSPPSLTALLGAKDARECTPLMLASSKGHVECMRLLLQHSPGAQVAAVDDFGQTALRHAAYSGHASCLPLLLAHSPGPQVASTDRLGCNALMHAAAGGHPACMRLLLAHSPGTQVAATDASGVNALMEAARNGHPSCVTLLLAHSPEVQMAAGSADGKGALCAAVARAHTDCLRLLLAHSPCQQQLDRALGEAGQKLAELRPPPADEPLQRGLKKCVELLLSHGAMPGAQAGEGAIAAIRPIVRELAARALVPDMANEAVVGLALAAAGSRKRQAGGEDAAAARPSQRACISP